MSINKHQVTKIIMNLLVNVASYVPVHDSNSYYSFPIATLLKICSCGNSKLKGVVVTPKGIVFRPKCLKTTPFGVTTTPHF